MGDSDPTEGSCDGPRSEQFVRGEVLASDCPSRSILQHVTSRWGVLALLALSRGIHRFSELQQRLGANERMLAQTLQRLEADGMVLCLARSGASPHEEYSLTPLGEEIAPKVEALADWIEFKLQRILTAQHEHMRRRPRRRVDGGVLSGASAGSHDDDE